MFNFSEMIVLVYFILLLIEQGYSKSQVGQVLNACYGIKPYYKDIVDDPQDHLYIYDWNGGDILFSINKTSLANRKDSRDDCAVLHNKTISVLINDIKGKSRPRRGEINKNGSGNEVEFQLEDGIVKISGDSYTPDDYCILGYNKTHIDLTISCPTQPNKCKDPTKPCIPKCCDMNQILEWDSVSSEPKCRPSGLNRWRPFIYRNPRESWRLLDDGSITILNDYRKWERLDPDQPYCLDGLQNDNKNRRIYSGDEEDQILLVCVKPVPANEIDLESDFQQKDLLYLSLCYISAFFYLLTTLVYLVLFSKTNSNVWTVLGHIGSLFMLKSLVGTCHLMNYLGKTYPKLEIMVNTWESWGLAVSIHFFVLSAYVWIALMSFDLMRTIRSRTLISKRGKKCWRFLIYSLMGWGLPFVTIVVFVVLDIIFADPITEIRVPEYGQYNFFIPPEAQGPYLFYIITGILLVNLIFVIMSMTSMLSSRRNSQSLSAGEFCSTNNDYISSRLFIKLFILTGSLWFLEVISWLHAGQTNPWYYVITDIIVQLQSVWTFIILVCNPRTLSRLKNKLDKWIGWVNNKKSDILNSKSQSSRRVLESSSIKSVLSDVTTL